MNNIGIVILAAGGSARLGSPKQLIKDNQGVSLIRKTGALVKSLNCKKNVIILGANHEIIQLEINELGVPIVYNPDWQSGISTSIKKAVEFLIEDDLDGILFLVCDQPYLNKNILETMLYKYQNTAKNIVACKYNDVLGTPAIFHSSFFTELLKLKGDKGAGKIINENVDKTVVVSFEKGSIDIDTKEDYYQYINDK